MHNAWPNHSKSDYPSHLILMGRQHEKELIHQIIPHITCLFNCKSQTILEFGDACIKETVSVTRDIHNRDIA
jgi:hypothetical protein